MIRTMTRRSGWCLAAACLGACVINEPEPPALSSVDQYGMNMQGMNMQGMNMQSMNMQGMNMQGIMLDGATIGPHNLHDVHVEAGEVVAERGGQTLRGTALVGARFV